LATTALADRLTLPLPDPGREGFEMFVYVDDIDGALGAAEATGGRVLREPANMAWGERIGWVSGPEGNPVALALP
jgi:predicted enzyme related to lactoylglutathione lyase